MTRRLGRPAGWWIASGAMVVVILIATVTPSRIGPEQPFSSCVLCGFDALADAVRNVILFVPLGLALGLATGEIKRPFVFALAFSACIELSQQWIPGRDPSIGDVITNATGALIGLTMIRRDRAWIRRSGWWALGAGVFAAAAFVVGGWLLQPIYPPGVYYGQWTPDLGYVAWYRGKVLSAAIGNAPLPSHELANSDTVVRLLEDGVPLRITAVAGPPVDDLSSLFSIYDSHQVELFLIGPDATSLVVRQRLRAWNAKMDQPDYPIPGLTLGAPGDTDQVTVWRRGNTFCVSVNEETRCAIGPTIGTEWALLWFTRALPRWTRAALDLLYVAALVFPFGFWARRDAAAFAGAVMIAAALALGPAFVGLLPTPPLEWLAALAGGVAGHIFGRFLRSRNLGAPATVL